MQERHDLDAIEARRAKAKARWYLVCTRGLDPEFEIVASLKDIPALLAYVRELEAAIVEYAATVRKLECEDYAEWIQKERSFEIITSLLEPKP